MARVHELAGGAVRTGASGDHRFRRGWRPRDGVPVDLGVLKQRALMAMLLIHANRVVSTDHLIDELWAGDAGKDSQNALWVNISRLRSTLEPDRAKRSDGTVLVTRPPGYLLSVDPERIDAVRFETLTREGRSLLDTDQNVGR